MECTHCKKTLTGGLDTVGLIRWPYCISCYTNPMVYKIQSDLDVRHVEKYRDDNGDMVMVHCPDCHGNGYIFVDYLPYKPGCKTCRGSGEIPRGDTLTARALEKWNATI